MTTIDGIVTFMTTSDASDVNNELLIEYTVRDINSGFEVFADIEKQEVIGRPLGLLKDSENKKIKDWFTFIEDFLKNQSLRESELGKAFLLTKVRSKENEILVIVKAYSEENNFDNLTKSYHRIRIDIDDLLDSLPLGVQIFDKHGICVMMNSTQAKNLVLPNKYYGIGVFNILFDSVMAISDSCDFYKKVYESKLTHNRICEIETCSDEIGLQNKRVFNETVIPFLDNQNNLKYVVTLLEDVTVRANTEKALIESEYRWKFAIEGNGDGLWDYNIKNGEVSFSGQWKALLGYSPEEINLNLEEWRRRVHPDDLFGIYADIKKHIDGETDIYINEHRLRCKDGYYKWVLDRGKVMEWEEDGSPSRMIGTISDITYRKEMETALRESELKYRSVVNAIHDGILLVDKMGKIITINRAAENILGIRQAQVIGKSIVEQQWKVILEDGSIFNFDSHAAIVTLRTGKPKYNLIFGVYKHDETLVWLSMNIDPVFIGKEKRPSFVVASFFDITHLKNRERKLEISQKELLEMNEAKDRFLSILGHDLRSPFNQMTILAEFIRKDLENKKYDEIGQILDMITKSSNQGSLLLANLLDWSRSQMGRVNVNATYVSLQTILTETKDLLTPTAFNKGITIRIDVPENLYVWADEMMVKTVLRNIIANAIKFSFMHGEVEVHAKEEEDRVIVSVVDHGVGIKSEDMSKLFRINETVTTLGTASEKGSGLGLIISKEFIEKNGGSIWVESGEGKGSVFFVSIPKAASG